MMYVTPSEYIPGTIAETPTQKRKQRNQATTDRTTYKDVICCFDIETTRIPKIEHSFMYVWMFHIHNHCTVVGRTWEEFRHFIAQVVSELDGNTLCIYVHNLSYEFQFLRAVWEWEKDDVFAVDRRTVLKAKALSGALEFRCSYLHSNMSLATYTKKFHVKHQKLSGEVFDYSKMRYPWTPLTDAELEYCINDVIGLAEALEIEMQSDNDNLYTIPLTSTGYVRRDAKRAMRKVNHMYVKEQLPDIEVYKMLREAFRGGNTHANRYYAGRIIKNVKSADRSSSYPEVVCNCLFPVTQFCRRENGMSVDELLTMKNVRKRALVMRVSMTNVRLKNKYWGCPYLSRDKCRRIPAKVINAEGVEIAGATYDNGRILWADYLETTITDIDLDIILDEYDFDDLCCFDCAYAQYGKLPRSLIETCIDYYVKKTTLKNVDGQELLYMKSKNKLNSIYGMMAQDPVKMDVVYSNGEWLPVEKLLKCGEWVNLDKATEKLLKSNQKAFLCYQWGVWVTAHARYALEEGVRLAGDGFIYCDTDSVKYIGDADFSKYNNGRITASKDSGAYATDPKGETHYMGVYEQEQTYNEFKTLGAKKYAYNYEPGGKTHVTIAGVTKSKGGVELDENGGLPAFKEGFVFVKAGGTESIYNDEKFYGYYEADGRKIALYPNIVIKDSTYTLGITEEYKSILENSVLPLDFW